VIDMAYYEKGTAIAHKVFTCSLDDCGEPIYTCDGCNAYFYEDESVYCMRGGKNGHYCYCCAEDIKNEQSKTSDAPSVDSSGGA
jgi:hypothetical protein